MKTVTKSQVWIALSLVFIAGQFIGQQTARNGGSKAGPAGFSTTSQPSRAGGTLYVAASDATALEKASADRVCDGNADQAEIQFAMDALVDTGGSVTLSSGTFTVTAPIDLVGQVHLRGQGRGTTIRAASGFVSGAGIVQGLYHGVGEPIDLATVSFLTIDGNRWNGAVSRGVHLNITSQVGFRFGSPDALFQMHDVLIANVNGHGVHLEGSKNRVARLTDVHVWNVEGHGFLLESADANYTDCDTGSSGLAGFRITGSNNHFTTCKGWYSDGDGFDISGVRNTFTGCTAQDNEQHGFAIRSSFNTLTGCHADSNSYFGGGTNPDTNQGVYDGFHLATSQVGLSACFAYDKNEGNRGRNQRYGTYVSGNRTGLNVQVCNGNANTHSNLVGGLGGGYAAPGNYFIATGQDTYVTP